jgi:hypothetical protein
MLGPLAVTPLIKAGCDGYAVLKLCTAFPFFREPCSFGLRVLLLFA